MKCLTCFTGGPVPIVAPMSKFAGSAWAEAIAELNQKERSMKMYNEPKESRVQPSGDLLESEA